MKKLLAILAIIALAAGCEEHEGLVNNTGVPPAGTRLIDKISIHYEYINSSIEAHTNEYIFSYDSRNRVVKMDYYGLEGGETPSSTLSYSANTLTITSESVYNNYPTLSGERKTVIHKQISAYNLNSDGYISTGQQTSEMHIEGEQPYDPLDIEIYRFSAQYNNNYIDSDETYIKWNNSEEEERTIKNNYSWSSNNLTEMNTVWLNKDLLNELELVDNIEYSNITNPSNVNIDISYLVLPSISDTFGLLIPALGFLGNSNETLPSSMYDGRVQFLWEMDKDGYIIKGEKNNDTHHITFEITYKN